MFVFALKTLIFDRGKFFIAIAGVVFSIVLVNLQMGLFLGLVRKGSVLIDNVKAEIWVGRHGVENVEFAGEIPESWLQRVRSCPGVDDAEIVIINEATMTLPNGEYETIWVIGFERATKLGGAWNISQGDARQLDWPDSVSIEELEAWKLGNPKIGDLVEINGSRARIAAMTKGILTFTAAPYVFTNIDSARTYGRMPAGFCSYIIANPVPGTKLDEIVSRIKKLIPEADVFTSKEFSGNSRMHWIARTGIGISFGGATVLGLIIGLVMVAQSLYALTLDHVEDYAALKAIGAEDRHVFLILITQALTIAVLGIGLGLATVFMVEAHETPMAEIDLPLWLVASGVFLNILICSASSMLPFHRISVVDPVTILQR